LSKIIHQGKGYYFRQYIYLFPGVLFSFNSPTLQSAAIVVQATYGMEEASKCDKLLGLRDI
jgi:hypothetical protein